MYKTAFYTLGCKLNQFETESLADAFRRQKFTLVDYHEKADLYIINTCTVTSKSEQKARRMIRKVLSENPSALVLVTGCYAQLNAQTLADLSDRVVVVPQDSKEKILSLAGSLSDIYSPSPLHREDLAALLDGIPVTGNRFAFDPGDYVFHSRAFVKIQDGCDGQCAYCRVPLARGKSVSLDGKKILERIHLVLGKGFREIVLTGINISSYSWKGMNLSGLLSSILRIDKPFRLRLSSLEPEKIGPDLIDVVKNDRVCPHFHLPVQSGSDTVLSAMKRRYKSEKVREAAAALRRARPDCFLAADVITGFPGESEEDFNRTLELVRDIPFSYLHVFPFSPRPGTTAFHFKRTTAASIIKKRTEKMIALSSRLHGQYLDLWPGSVLEVVLEEDCTEPGSENRMWKGLSANYCRCFVSGMPEKQAYRRNSVSVLVEKTDGQALYTKYC
ncbi:MAG: tRNA (N(6)-L-threonylcarbamoyladenosine(37)-C(2))-methylthiotransferase MtaB [Spirochaetales bacterium]|nr:tRNA (N(6)-L-threonylcarbamoyladenosine(37)-C(2))-methylthiotransferase MtaB [Spirochaetales bacterium]